MPTVEDDLRQRARAHIDAQHWTAAQAALESLLHHAPQDVAVRMEMARVMLRQGLFRASGCQLLNSVRAACLLLVIFRILKLCSGFVQRRIVAARTRLDRVGQLADASVPLMLAQAHLRWTLGEFGAARRLMDRAAAAGLDSPDQFHLHATLLQVTGDIERAGQVLETCLRRWPDFGDAATAR